jgi:hypothetical protein
MENDIEYLINNSLCKHCTHRVIRDISAEGLTVLNEFDEPEDLSDDTMEDFIHISCTKLCIDLDHIVLDCNKFLSNEKTCCIKNLFVDSSILDRL